MRGVRLPISFCKMSGAGNDFLVIDHRTPVLDAEQMAEFARRVCRRRVSVGADGLFLIEPSAQVDFRWRFFNADGSEAEMCGNGARCVARFAYLHGIAPARMRFETLAGVVEAEVAGSQVTIGMPAPHSLRRDIELEAGGRRFIGDGINTGVPHLVLFVDDLACVDVEGLGRALRFHPQFAPAGTNVNFIGRTQAGFAIRTYERGVETETLACGTGVTAAALILAVKELAAAPVAIATRGGATLMVRFSRDGSGLFTQVELEGPAHLIYRGELGEEALLD
jgi:diaminopimelate epimerase